MNCARPIKQQVHRRHATTNGTFAGANNERASERASDAIRRGPRPCPCMSTCVAFTSFPAARPSPRTRTARHKESVASPARTHSGPHSSPRSLPGILRICQEREACCPWPLLSERCRAARGTAWLACELGARERPAEDADSDATHQKIEDVRLRDGSRDVVPLQGPPLALLRVHPRPQRELEDEELARLLVRTATEMAASAMRT